jgi:molecular chaperone GrpE
MRANDSNSQAEETSPEAPAQPSEAEVVEAQTPTEAESESEPLESPEVLTLRADLEKSRKRVDELARAYQALDKDREEFKQRLNRERERMVDVERGKVATMVLEALDELDRLLRAAGDEQSPITTGVRLIRDSLLKKVEAAGVERLELVGQRYDPNVAEAADMEITTHPDEDQKIVAELQAGYRLKDKVIRPAKVKVAKYIQPAQA